MNNQTRQNVIVDDEGDDFWDLVACATAYIAIYYVMYIHKEPCMTSFLTGERWMNELLSGNERRCFNMLRMNPDVFQQLCNDLETEYGLCSSHRMSIIEKVGLYVYTLSKGASNRDVQERFQRSGETVSRVFKEVLDAMDGLIRDILRPRDPEFKEIPSKIANDDRYMPYFKDYIGAIDGTHISVVVPEEDQLRYRGRKSIPTTNVLAACDFDLLFTYVLPGWEGSAHDSRIFLDAIGNPSLKFPYPPRGKYYLADKGYPERVGYLTPYPKVKYHENEFRGAPPRGSKELFNMAHSSLRNCIERAFGVLKARWKILGKMPQYTLQDQNRIICGTFALHNYIRRNTIRDEAFKIIDENPDFIPPDVLQDVANHSSQPATESSGTKEMSTVRDNITSSLMASRRNRH
ncbi:uncharacterized protein LOC141595707 [Silene latifolia]|uniref:uncharacterized protein LOC141595707 n=1 Tax=Silene latifolia TaxID=37657 RepID=UPI003D7712C8